MKNVESSSAGLPDDLKVLAIHFQKASGVPCFPVDAEGNTLVASPGNADQGTTAGCDSACNFCLRSSDRQPGGIFCDRAAIHRHGLTQAKRFGGSYIYFCPANLIYWASPVVVNGATLGALVAGSVLMVEPDDYLDEDILTQPTLSTEKLSVLRNQLKSIPYVPPSRVSSLAKVLGDMAFSFSQKLSNNLVWETTAETQQARISEYIHQLKRDSAVTKVPSYPMAKEKALLSLIVQGDQINANLLLNEILGAIFFSSGRDLAQTKTRISELIVLMSRASLEGGARAQDILALNNSFLPHIQKSSSIEGLTADLAAMLKRFTDHVFCPKSARHADLLQKAVQYLNANYAKSIDLQSVSAHVHMSASHFSKVFKEEMGKSFVHYLNHIRVERSKDLLRDRSIALADIAGRLGFEDQSYFTKVFCKLTGMSPGRYRNNRGQPLEANLEIHDRRKLDQPDPISLEDLKVLQIHRFHSLANSNKAVPMMARLG